MRDILFRGKRFMDGQWVDGSLFIDEKKDKHEVLVGYVNYRVGWEVEPSTVGQYTGMTDKHGKKIFEGDIVESQYTQKPYLVCFGEYTYTDKYEDEQEAWGWYNQDIKGHITAFSYPESWATVIGNIHDNPELIGGNDGQ